MNCEAHQTSSPGALPFTKSFEDARALCEREQDSFWPLVQRHNWTGRDSIAAARRVLLAPHRYPKEREQDLAAYCPNVLGLRKPPGPPGRTSPDGCPPGYEAAFRLRPPATASS